MWRVRCELEGILVFSTCWAPIKKKLFCANSFPNPCEIEFLFTAGFFVNIERTVDNFLSARESVCSSPLYTRTTAVTSLGCAPTWVVINPCDSSQELTVNHAATFLGLQQLAVVLWYSTYRIVLVLVIFVDSTRGLRSPRPVAAAR